MVKFNNMDGLTDSVFDSRLGSFAHPGPGEQTKMSAGNKSMYSEPNVMRSTKFSTGYVSKT